MKKSINGCFIDLLLASVILSLVACGSSTGSGDSTLTYSETVEAYATETTSTYTKGKAVGDTYSAAAALDLASDGVTDSDTIYTTMTAFLTALDNYSTHITNVGTYAATTFPSKTSSNVAASSVSKDAGSIGADAGLSIYELNATLQAKAAECKTLKDQIPTNMSDLDAFMAAKKAYETCNRELMAKAAEEGFKVVVVGSGGSAAGGAAAGAAFIYVVGGGAAALLTGPGILVVAAGAYFGGKAATALYEYCTSSSDKSVSKFKGVSAGNYCAAASASGNTGQAMAMNTTGGTGTLHVTIDGYAPVMLENITVSPGQTLTVYINPVELTAVTDESSGDIESASDDGSSSGSTSTASSCSEVITIGAQNSPADPSPLETVTVTATVVPAVGGCTVAYSVSGTDGYSDSGSPATNSSGQISFTIPGGAEGVNDVVTITESATSVGTTLTYIF